MTEAGAIFFSILAVSSGVWAACEKDWGELAISCCLLVVVFVALYWKDRALRSTGRW